MTPDFKLEGGLELRLGPESWTEFELSLPKADVEIGLEPGATGLGVGLSSWSELRSGRELGITLSFGAVLLLHIELGQRQMV